MACQDRTKLIKEIKDSTTEKCNEECFEDEQCEEFNLSETSCFLIKKGCVHQAVPAGKEIKSFKPQKAPFVLAGKGRVCMDWSPYITGKVTKGKSAEECNKLCVANPECVEFSLGNSFGKGSKLLGKCQLYKPGCDFKKNPAYDYYQSTMLPSIEPDVCTFKKEYKSDVLITRQCPKYTTAATCTEDENC